MLKRRNYYRPRLPLHLPSAATVHIVVYSSIIFFISLGDSVMAYFSPVYVQQYAKDPLLMGVIIATSSGIGVFVDFILGKNYANQNYRFFLKWALFGAIAFPLIMLLPQYMMVILMGMVIWGIYFELILFANFRSVSSLVDHHQHGFAWGIIKTFQSAAYLIGPLLSSIAMTSWLKAPIYIAVSMHLIAIFLFFCSYRLLPRHNRAQLMVTKSTLWELSIWKTLGSRLWPVLFFVFVLTLVDATFWSIGALASESFKANHFLGGHVITAYLLPSLFVGVFAHSISRPLGKKKTAFLAGVGSGAFLYIAGQVASIPWFIIFVFCSSCFTALAVPLIMAAFEDYITRLRSTGNDLIGLENSFTSLSFVLGPIIAGALARVVGYQQVFSLIGLLMFITSICMLIIVPRKIRLPQKAIHSLKETFN